MPAIDLSGEILSASAGYQAGNWASVGAEAGLDMVLAAELTRGIDLGIGIQALANLHGGIRKFLTAGVDGTAHAAARVRAQVQVPLDLFDESGVAVRLQAVAEAAAGVQLAIGLAAEDFVALASSDPRMRGVPIELLKVFLDELSASGGVMAKAAAAAMAYAGVLATGSLVSRGDRPPGFTVAAEAGLGLKAGAGFRVFVRFGVADPRRLVRRTIDVAVDEALAAVAQGLSADGREAVAAAAVPLKIAFRSAFELGVALAERGGAFSPGAAETLALRLAQVGLEELQRFALERAVEFASAQIREAIRDLAFTNATWAGALPERQSLANRLEALPVEPFEATDANRDYWLGVIADALALAAALTGDDAVPAFLAEPLSILWCCTQLLMKSVERISVADARAAVIGVDPATATAAFRGELPDAPGSVRVHINVVLEHPPGTPIAQVDAVGFLLRVLGYRLHVISPAAASVLLLLTGKAAAAEALSVVLSNIGSFAPGPDGEVDAVASLAVLRNALQTYTTTRLEEEVRPLLAGAPSEVVLYVDEVLLSTLRTTVDVVFQTVLDWGSGDGQTQTALREMCSALLMRLFGRSLVVAVDVLQAYTLDRIQAELRNVAKGANDPGGVAPILAGLTGLDRGLVADLVVETLEMCAETFRPMSAERRALARELLYQTMDTMPPAAGADFLESMKSAGMIGNAEAAMALTQLLGQELADSIVRFVGALLTRVATAFLALLADIIADMLAAIGEWLEGLVALGRELIETLARLAAEIVQLGLELEERGDTLLASVSSLLGIVAAGTEDADAVRNAIKAALTAVAWGPVAMLPGFNLAPGFVRVQIYQIVAATVDAVLDVEVFDWVLACLSSVAAEAAEIGDELRGIEPGDDLVDAIADIVLGRVEGAIVDVFGGDPSVPIQFTAPFVGTVNLGRVYIPLTDFLAVVGGAIRGLDAFADLVADVAADLLALLNTEAELAAAQAEEEAAKALQAEANALTAEANDPSLDLIVVNPAAGSSVSGTLTVELRVPSGSPALLSSEGLSQQRLRVWVNASELSLADAEVRVETPIMDTKFPGLIGTGGLLNPGDLGPSRAGRARRGPGPVVHPIDPRVGSFNAGRVDLIGGRTLGAGGQPGRFTAGIGRLAGALVVRVGVPPELLHEGINSLACVLAPGHERRRIERAVSFLYSLPGPSRPGRPVMPVRLPGAELPPFLREILAGRGVPDRRRRTAREAPRALPGGRLTPPQSELARRAGTARAALQADVAAASRRLEETRAIVAAGGLRPAAPGGKPPRAAS